MAGSHEKVDEFSTSRGACIVAANGRIAIRDGVPCGFIVEIGATDCARPASAHAADETEAGAEASVDIAFGGPAIGVAPKIPPGRFPIAVPAVNGSGSAGELIGKRAGRNIAANSASNPLSLAVVSPPEAALFARNNRSIAEFAKSDTQPARTFPHQLQQGPGQGISLRLA